MTLRAALTLVARTATTGFFLLTAAYCILSYNSFTYHQFIKPEVLAWPGDFVALHHVLFLLAWLLTALTLSPFLTARPPVATTGTAPGEATSGWAKAGAWAYLAATGAIALWLVTSPFLATVDNRPRSLVAGLLFLTIPLALSAIDHLIVAPPRLVPLDEARLGRSCATTALLIWASYAIAAPYRLATAPGVDLPSGAMLIGLAGSAVGHAMTFAALFLSAACLVQIARLFRGGPAAEYWLLLAAAFGGLSAILHIMVLGAVGFAGWPGRIAAIMLSATITLAWSGTARHVAAARGEALDAVELLVAPARVRPDRARLFTMVLLPFAAVLLARAVEQMDWDFLLQKSGVLVVWVAAFTLVYARPVRPRLPQRRSPSTRAALGTSGAVVAVYCLASIGMPVLASQTADARLSPELAFDRYAAVDPSFRVIHATARANTGEAAEFYKFLKDHSTIAHVQVAPVDIDFVRPLGPPARRPHIFLFMVDSLRRDYLSAYNPAVGFTPAFGAFARDSFVFERAFSRYGATGLAVPSLWVGGMTLHMQYIRPFTPMNTLVKLLDAAGYQRLMSVDSIAERINEGVPGPQLRPLDRGIPTKQYDFCRTLGELEQVLVTDRGERPIFAYTLPQNVHIANAFETPVPEGASYPGFVDKVAAPVERLDGCFGSFIDRLKVLGLYDQSVIVVTSDHGDSLGEEGRFGHAYTVFPEVMRIPLIVRLPTMMARELSTDLARVAFSADLTPTLYALLGYEPADLGPLYGTPLFRPRSEPHDERRRRRDPFLLASSYGAVYGMLRHNGRSLYIADAVAGRDYAYDLSDGGLGRRLEITDAMRRLNWQLIREQVTEIARQYRFTPKP